MDQAKNGSSRSLGTARRDVLTMIAKQSTTAKVTFYLRNSMAACKETAKMRDMQLAPLCLYCVAKGQSRADQSRAENQGLLLSLSKMCGCGCVCFVCCCCWRPCIAITGVYCRAKIERHEQEARLLDLWRLHQVCENGNGRFRISTHPRIVARCEKAGI